MDLNLVLIIFLLEFLPVILVEISDRTAEMCFCVKSTPYKKQKQQKRTGFETKFLLSPWIKSLEGISNPTIDKPETNTFV